MAELLAWARQVSAADAACVKARLRAVVPEYSKIG